MLTKIAVCLIALGSFLIFVFAGDAVKEVESVDSNVVVEVENL